MELSSSDLDYFNRGKDEIIKFFSRLNGVPDFKGLKILDIGCGHGRLCVYAAENGAKQVIGLDINSPRVDFAKENLNQNYPQLLERIEFKNCNINELNEFDFDIILSKDSFEHIIGLEDLMHDMIERLKPGGSMLIGFGPLYNSPYGDHRRTLSIIPWGHLLRSEKNIIKKINDNRDEKIASIYDLGLNKFSLAQYENLFYNCRMEVCFFGVNVSTNPISNIFSLISKIHFLRELFSHNIYCILKKPNYTKSRFGKLEKN